MLSIHTCSFPCLVRISGSQRFPCTSLLLTVIATSAAAQGPIWLNVSPCPSPRKGHAMVYDNARERVLLFGGNMKDRNPSGETWEWNGGDWNLLTESGPAPRSSHAMAYDSARDRVVLFGGWNLEVLPGHMGVGRQRVDPRGDERPQCAQLPCHGLRQRPRPNGAVWGQNAKWRLRGNMGVGWHDLDPADGVGTDRPLVTCHGL